MNNLINKKIGIWGFGVVGKSALNYFDQFKLASIQVIDSKIIVLPSTNNQTIAIEQTSESIQQFLDHNDVILVSPGIKLHDYQEYTHKFLSELDIYQQHATWPNIAITGSLGKTSITHLLTSILKKMHINAIAAGNIGNAMLNIISSSNNVPDITILEVSSFQLQQAQIFAPDLAIITNLYENHLDHHKSMQEYTTAKCNIFMHQSKHQRALIPVSLVNSINAMSLPEQSWALFTPSLPTDLQSKQFVNNVIYYLDRKKVYKKFDIHTKLIFDLTDIPAITFDENWLIIIAALDLQNLDYTNLTAIAEQLDIPDHRLQKIKSFNGSDFYNDSKSTVWQATLQAVISLETLSKQPIKLFVGGLSKGADRTPLFAAIADKAIQVFAFGKESQQIAELCQKFNITCSAHATLDQSFDACIATLTTPSQILFSPGGSSFDLFADYKDRGQHFVQLVENL